MCVGSGLDRSAGTAFRILETSPLPSGTVRILPYASSVPVSYTHLGHDLAGEGNQEASASSNLDVPHGNGEAFGSAQLGLVVGEGVLRLSLIHIFLDYCTCLPPIFKE